MMNEQPTSTINQTVQRVLEQYMPKIAPPSKALFDEKKFREMLPPEMLLEKRWMRYFLQPKATGGSAKIPLGNHAEESTWSTFDECVAALEPGNEQVIAFTAPP